jgi:hypothetical protein
MQYVRFFNRIFFFFEKKKKKKERGCFHSTGSDKIKKDAYGIQQTFGSQILVALWSTY